MKTLNTFNIDVMLTSYLETLLWSNEELDCFSNLDVDDNCKEKAKADILQFVENVKKDPIALEEANSYTDKVFAHNFCLSRNRHGAGFFDEWNDTLQKLANDMKEVEVYLGDDNKIYF